MIDEQRLSEILLQDVTLRLVEPHIYSPYGSGENTNPYHRMGNVYDLVACSRLYNRIVWGYKTDAYHALCLDALRSSKGGWVLDAGCGSLAFTARAYADYTERPVVFLDQSITLLRLAKSRLAKLNGKIPDSMVFLHGDILRLPFKPKSFGTVMALNVLHVLQDARVVVQELRKVLLDGGMLSLTTLIEGGRLADKYLHMLGKAGALVPRTADELFAVFEALGMPIECSIQGNMAFIYCK